MTEKRTKFTVFQKTSRCIFIIIAWPDANLSTKHDVKYHVLLCFRHGYPDATYLQRVKDELAAKGVVPETDTAVANGNKNKQHGATGKNKTK